MVRTIPLSPPLCITQMHSRWHPFCPDKQVHDRLCAAAFTFCEKIAIEAGGTGVQAAAASSAGSAGASSAGVGSAGASSADASTPPVFHLIEPQPKFFLFKVIDTAAPEGHRSFACQLQWLDGFAPGCTLRFPTVRGRADGLSIKLPSDPSIVGKTIRVTAHIDTAAVPRAKSFRVTHLMSDAPLPPPLPQPTPAPPPPPAHPSQWRPPIAVETVDARLLGKGFELHKAAPHGDCMPLSALGSIGELTPQEARHPTEAALARVATLRGESVDAICGATVGGVDGRAFRVAEGQPPDGDAMEVKLAPWRELGHWISSEAGLSALFSFGCAVKLSRPIIVLQLSEDGDHYLDPATVYGARGPAGELLLSQERANQPATVPPLKRVSIDDAIAMLDIAPQPALLSYDFDGRHFDYFVKTAQELAPTEVAEGDLGCLDETEAMVTEGSLAANAMQQLAENHPPLLDNGEASVELQRDSPEAAGAIEDPPAPPQAISGGMPTEGPTERLAALGCVWKDAEQTQLLGTWQSYQRADELSVLLSEMDVEAVTVTCPGMTLSFARSEYGQRNMFYSTSHDPSAVGADPDETQLPDDYGLGDGAAEPASEESEILDCGLQLGTEAGQTSELVELVAEEASTSPAAPVAQSIEVVAVVPRMRKTESAEGERDAAARKQPAANALDQEASHRKASVAAPPSKRKQRAAARRAVEALGVTEEGVDESPPPKVAKSEVVIAPDVTEASLEDALAGAFSRFEVVRTPPEWLGDALQPNSATAAQLHGALMVYRWEEYGWAPARLGPTADATSNFGALYVDEWRQDHTLQLNTYGGTAYGSWFLLRATRACSPIHDYSRGLYQKLDGGKDVWRRGSSVLHHTADELKQARDAAAARAAEEEDAKAEQELDTTGISLGDKLLAKGLAPHGEVVFYEAVVLALRKRFPPLKARAAAFERMP
jgi:hypothetical protein